jgi:hypothetical protein
MAYADFSQNFFAAQNYLLTMQMQQLQAGQSALTRTIDNSQNIAYGVTQSSSEYFYGLADRHTTYLNQLGKTYGAALTTATKKLGRGGLLGLLGF